MTAQDWLKSQPSYCTAWLNLVSVKSDAWHRMSLTKISSDSARIVKLGGVEALASLINHKNEAIASSAVDTLLSLSWEGTHSNNFERAPLAQRTRELITLCRGRCRVLGRDQHDGINHHVDASKC